MSFQIFNASQCCLVPVESSSTGVANRVPYWNDDTGSLQYDRPLTLTDSALQIATPIELNSGTPGPFTISCSADVSVSTNAGYFIIGGIGLILNGGFVRTLSSGAYNPNLQIVSGITSITSSSITYAFVGEIVHIALNFEFVPDGVNQVHFTFGTFPDSNNAGIFAGSGSITEVTPTTGNISRIVNVKRIDQSTSEGYCNALPDSTPMTCSVWLQYTNAVP